MRIAFFSDTFRPNMDGVVTAMVNLEGGLRGMGHEVKYFAAAPQDRKDEEEGVAYCPSFPFPPYPAYRIAYGGKDAEREIASWKPDIIHCHAMATMALTAKKMAKEYGIPMVGTFHTMLPDAVHYITKVEGLQEWGVDLTWRYLHWLYKDFDVVTAPSEYVKALLAKHDIPSTVLPGGIDTSKFTPGKIPSDIAEWFEFEGAKFLFVGRIVKEKNIDYIFELAKTKEWKAAACRAYIVGEGPYKKEYEAKVASAVAKGEIQKHAIFFEGRVPLHVLIGFYRAADLFLFPSRFETQGLVALEAMACGTPVAAFGGTAAGEIVAHGKTGAVLGNSDSLPQSMEKILAAARGKRKMAAQCRKAAVEFDLKRYAKNAEKIYRKLV